MTVDLSPEQRRSVAHTRYTPFMTMPSTQQLANSRSTSDSPPNESVHVHVPASIHHNNKDNDDDEEKSSVKKREKSEERERSPKQAVPHLAMSPHSRGGDRNDRKRSHSTESDSLNLMGEAASNHHNNNSSFLIKDILKDAANQSQLLLQQAAAAMQHHGVQASLASQLQGASPPTTTSMSNNNPLSSLSTPYPQDLSLRSAAILSAAHHQHQQHHPHSHHPALSHPAFGLFANAGANPLSRLDMPSRLDHLQMGHAMPGHLGRLSNDLHHEHDDHDHDIDGMDDADEDICSTDAEEERNCSDSAKSNSSSK
ncbi:unnamed protein product [Sphagnum balticum]